MRVGGLYRGRLRQWRRSGAGWGVNGLDIYSSDGGAVMPKWITFFCFWLKKSTGLILSGHRMTTGFGNIELPTRGLLQNGREHSLPKFCFAELASPAFWLAQLLLWAFTVLKLLNRLGVGGQRVELLPSAANRSEAWYS